MNLLQEFPVHIGKSIIHKANGLKIYYDDNDKFQRVYIRCLTLYAVDFYFNSMGLSTNLRTNDIWNPVMQRLLDSSSLNIKNIGEVECIPILINQNEAQVPADAFKDRNAYIVVQFTENLDLANILGFTTNVESKILKTNLQPINDILDLSFKSKNDDKSDENNIVYLPNQNNLIRFIPRVNTKSSIRVGSNLRTANAGGYSPQDTLLFEIDIFKNSDTPLVGELFYKSDTEDKSKVYMNLKSSSTKKIPVGVNLYISSEHEEVHSETTSEKNLLSTDSIEGIISNIKIKIDFNYMSENFLISVSDLMNFYN